MKTGNLIKQKLRKASLLGLISLGLTNCLRPEGNKPESSKNVQKLENAATKQLLPKKLKDTLETETELSTQTVLVAGLSTQEALALKEQLNSKKIEVKGETVLRISGTPTALLSELQGHEVNSNSITIQDEVVKIERPISSEVSSDGLYLAKKDFGLLEFWKKHPEWDGRNVVIGVVDDGISPHQSAFLKTTDGKRKLIGKAHPSSALKFKLGQISDVSSLSPYANSIGTTYGKVLFESKITEPPIIIGDEPETLEDDAPKVTYLDLNANEVQDSFSVLVTETNTICIDLNQDEKYQAFECGQPFSVSGHVLAWEPKKDLVGTVEWDASKQLLILSPGEGDKDSHGEGVASVAAGYQEKGPIVGVAPGAQIFDYDVYSVDFAETKESAYTIGSFIEAFEVLGKNGVDVANVSYSFFFNSAKSLQFMQTALQKIIETYNMVLSFSAGNNGPGLMSLNRRAIYPDAAIVNGAFVGPELYEIVHGVTGLPEQGRVVSYSSRGPGTLHGKGPDIISPLASLAHSNPQEGFKAFGGTSSASPATAGLAAVLISALKAQNIEVDASTVSAAIKLSGKPLVGVPYIEQGHGIPQIETALAIYSDLMAGKTARSYTTEIKRPGPDGSEAQGVFIRLHNPKDQLREIEIRVGANLSKLAPIAAQREFLKRVKLEYSHDYFSGPENLWVSIRDSAFFVSVDLEKLKKDLAPGAELFSEIKLVDQPTGRLILTIPVTVVNDVPLDGTVEKTYVLTSEESTRFHFSGIGTLGALVSVQSDTPRRFRMFHYNTSGRQTESKVLRAENSSYQMLFETDPSGWNQFAFSRYKGSMAEAQYHVKIEPIKLKLLSKFVSKSKGEISIFSNATGKIPLSFDIKPAKDYIVQNVSSLSDDLPSAFVTAKLEKGIYLGEVTKLFSDDIEFSWPSCFWEVYREEKLQRTSYSEQLTLKEAADVNYLCYPFDNTSTSETTSVFAQELWQGIYQKPEEKFLSSTKFQHLKPGKNKITLKLKDEITSGQKGVVVIRQVDGEGLIEVGEVTIF